MLNCNCNELCFYYKKTSLIEIDGKKYTQTHNFNKCNRLIGENSKKKPCNFHSKILIDEKLVENEIKVESSTDSDNKKLDKIVTYGDIRNKINDMFQHYYIKSSNYFGILNHYLKIIGYHAHDPSMESLSELKTRLSRKSSNVNKIYINKESYFSHTVGELDYDYDNEEEILKKIQIGDNPLAWTKNEILQDILTRKVCMHKKSNKCNKSNKSNKSIKSSNYNKVTSIKELMNKYEDEKEEQNEKENNKQKVTPYQYKENENEDEDEDEDKDEDNNSENLKDNEFDVEEFSDDDNDYDDNNYDDFSD